jgi:hypothetical protein
VSTYVSHPGSLREWRMGSTDPIIRAPVGSDSWEFVIHTGPPTNLGQPIPHHVPRSQPIQISLRQWRARLLRPPGRLYIKAFCLERIVVKFHSTILVTSVVHGVHKAQFFFSPLRMLSAQWQGYGLDFRGIVVWFPAGARNLLLI